MDLDRAFITKIIDSGEFHSVLRAGVTREHMEPKEAGRVFAALLKNWQKYHKMPDRHVFEHKMPEYELLAARKVTEPLQFYIDELKHRRRRWLVMDAFERSADRIDQDDVDGATALMMAGALAAAREEGTDDEDVAVGLEAVMEETLGRDPNAQIIGLPTSFPLFDRATLGFQPQQLITVIGGQKVGKTTLQLVMISTIRRVCQVPTMFVTIEMSKAEQYRRYLAMGAQVSHQRMLAGKLTPDEHQLVRNFEKEQRSWAPLWFISDQNRAATLTGLEAKIEQYKPAILFVDGVYFLRDEITGESGTTAALTNLTRGFKALAQRQDIPICVSTQALRSKMRNGKVTMDSIGYTSSFAQDSDVVLGVEEHSNGVVNLKVVVSRNSPPCEFLAEWNWEKGRFIENGSDPGASSD